MTLKMHLEPGSGAKLGSCLLLCWGRVGSGSSIYRKSSAACKGYICFKQSSNFTVELTLHFSVRSTLSNRMILQQVALWLYFNITWKVTCLQLQQKLSLQWLTTASSVTRRHIPEEKLVIETCDSRVLLLVETLTSAVHVCPKTQKFWTVFCLSITTPPLSLSAKTWQTV